MDDKEWIAKSAAVHFAYRIEIIKFENDTTLILKVCVPLESGKSYGIGIDTSVLYSKSNKYMSVGNNIKDIYFIMK